MIHTDLFQYSGKNNTKVVKSHRLQPEHGICIFCIIAGENASIVSILEDHILESLSTIEWEKSTLTNDFTYISENFNHFSQNIDQKDLEGLSIVLAVLIDRELVFSHIGNASILLIEQDGTINDLSNTDASKTEFQAISNGEVLPGSYVYLSNTSLEYILPDELLRDLCALNNVEWHNIIGDIFKKDIQDPVHVGYISHKQQAERISMPRKMKQLDILRAGSKELLSGLNITKKLETFKKILSNQLNSKQKEVKYSLLIVGIIIFFSLVYLLFTAISSVLNTPELDTKNQLLKAQELINNSQKIINNPAAFNANIAEAEAILFELRNKRARMNDTQSLLLRIEAMKKEVNDIQTIDLTKLNKIINTEGIDFEGIGSIEFDKKIGVIGTKSAIVGYSRGGTIPKEKSYPTGMIANDFDITEDGTLYILANNNRILSQRGDEIRYVNTNGKNEWNTSHILSTFNGNIYLSTLDKRGVDRYRPGINGFSNPNTIISQLEDDILDIGIDGGIYLLLKNGKISRYIGGSANALKNLNINKIPGEYNIGSEELTRLFVKPNLSYIYILSGKNVWIFSPDSKRFQDVTAWNYVAQLELQAPEEIKNIHIPRDGLIYISTVKSVYELVFEIADNKIILR